VKLVDVLVIMYAFLEAGNGGRVEVGSVAMLGMRTNWTGVQSGSGLVSFPF
jgi:hypothetical protein